MKKSDYERPELNFQEILVECGIALSTTGNSSSRSMTEEEILDFWKM